MTRVKMGGVASEELRSKRSDKIIASIKGLRKQDRIDILHGILETLTVDDVYDEICMYNELCDKWDKETTIEMLFDLLKEKTGLEYTEDKGLTEWTEGGSI